MHKLANIIASIEAAFASASGPARSLNPKHCEECAEADKRLLDLDPRDLNYQDLEDNRYSWILCFVTAEGLRWLFPGMVRVAFEQDPPDLRVIANQICIRNSDTFTEEQWTAISKLMSYGLEQGFLDMSDLSDIDALREFLSTSCEK